MCGAKTAHATCAPLILHRSERCSGHGSKLVCEASGLKSERSANKISGLEHDPEKWMPVFRKDHAPTKKLDHDPIQFDRTMVPSKAQRSVVADHDRARPLRRPCPELSE